MNPPPDVFVDTAAWLALFNADDALHIMALAVRKELYQRKQRLATTEFVLLETADALSGTRFRTSAARYLRALRREQAVEITPVSSELLADGLTLFEQRPDKEWSLTDCTSFVVMEQHGVRVAFTSDHHFEQAGFQKLL
ncbi:MAG TPA: PIN domain-containing protein [Armatimonadota bacterium]|nr:PIN domain-containing protein [Armatimonadota bacterium]